MVFSFRSGRPGESVSVPLLLATLLLLAALLPPAASAQVGTFGEDGFGAAIRGGVGTDVTALEGRIGIAQPAFEIGVSLSRETLEASNLRVTEAGPYVSFYPFRQGSLLPVSVALDGSVRLRTFSATSRAGGSAINGSALSTGIGVFRSIRAGESLRIIPRADAVYTRGVTRSGGLGSVDTETEDEIGADLGISFLVEFSETVHLAVTPHAFVGSGRSTYGASATFVLPGSLGE